jgi:hypothetical protein
MPIQYLQGYRYPQWVPSWGEGWLWKPLSSSNAGTYATDSPNEQYDNTQYGLGDFLVGSQTNKSIQNIAMAAMVVGAVMLFKK